MPAHTKIDGLRIVIRSDNSPLAGGGHIGRCMALASALKERNASVLFVTRDGNVNSAALIREAGFCGQVISGPSNWAADAAETAALAKNCDWVIIDHYGLDARWEKAMRASGAKIVTLDDLADRPHDCDILVDAGRRPDSARDYQGLVPAVCEMLLGPRYALLRPEFKCAKSGEAFGFPPRLVIFCGSADNNMLTERIIESLERSDLVEHLDVHVVVTSSNRQRDVLRERRVSIHEDVSDMAALYEKMDIAIGTGGVSLWERCAMGLPGIAIAVNSNQRPTVRLAAQAGAVVGVDIDELESPGVLDKLIADLATDRNRWQRMRESTRTLVDGNGAHRIAALMAKSVSRQPSGS